MTEPASEGPLAEALRDWHPPVVESARRVDPWQSAAFAALIDAPAPGEDDPLPPLWHWFTLLDHPAQAEIGEDGHPVTGPFMPPIPDRRRMFAGGRFEQWAPIPHGSELSSRSAVADVNIKTGRTGAMAFVTVVRSAFVPAVVVSAGSRAGDDVTVAVAAQGAFPSLTASIRLD
jgi:3-methylfumaryl-CoA hydratase